MTTRAKSGNPKYALFIVKANYPEPNTVQSALKDSCWTAAMSEEMGTMYEVDSWDMVPPEDNIVPLGCKWVFRTKLHSYGTLDKLKGRLVSKGYD